VAKKSTLKIGIVTIRAIGERRWQLRYPDPATGRDIRRRLSGLESCEAQAIAAHISQEALSAKGYIPGKTDAAPGVEDGIAETLRLSSVRDSTRRDLAFKARQFVVWLAERYPTVKTWDQLRPAMLQAYIRECEQRALAFDTIRLRVVPIKQAWRHMADNYPELVRPVPKIKLKRPPRKEIECLDPGEVALLLDWLRDHAPGTWPMGCLQALCGLRMLEAAALRVQDIHISEQTIEITDTGGHAPKTGNSHRTIPVTEEVIEALKTAMTGQIVRPSTGELFTNQRGDVWKGNSLTQHWTTVRRRAAKDTGSLRLANIPARKLRAAFATMASRLGVQDRFLTAYLGHSPENILARHYRRIDGAELRSVSDRMNKWRSLADSSAGWQHSGNSGSLENTNG